MNRRPDVLSLSFGLLFSVTAIVFLLSRALSFSINLRWLGPAALVLMGGGLLFSGVRRSRPDGRDRDDTSDTDVVL